MAVAVTSAMAVAVTSAMAVAITSEGWLLIWSTLSVVVLLAGIVFVMRRGRVMAGFDADEAATWVWATLTREERRRIALAHVVAAVRAVEDAADRPDDFPGQDALMMHVASRLAAEDMPLSDNDVARLVDLQVAYAEAKGLM